MRRLSRLSSSVSQQQVTTRPCLMVYSYCDYALSLWLSYLGPLLALSQATRRRRKVILIRSRLWSLVSQQQTTTRPCLMVCSCPVSALPLWFCYRYPRILAGNKKRKRSSNPLEALEPDVAAIDNDASLPDGLFLLCPSGFVS